MYLTFVWVLPDGRTIVVGSAGLTKQIDDRHRGHSLYVSYNSGGKKGATIELAHRNSQASVPFMISSRGYGFF